MTTTPFLTETLLEITIGNINYYSQVQWDESKVTIQNISHITDTPEDELLFMVKLTPTERYGLVDYYMTADENFTEYPIDIQELENIYIAQISDIDSNITYILRVQEPIVLKYSIILPILILTNREQSNTW